MIVIYLEAYSDYFMLLVVDQSGQPVAETKPYSGKVVLGRHRLHCYLVHGAFMCSWSSTHTQN